MILDSTTAVRLAATAVFAGAVVAVSAAPSSASHIARFSQPDYRAQESAGSIVVTVVRDDPGEPTTVGFATSDMTATAGTDYDTTTGSLRFESGEDKKTFSVRLHDDDVMEDDERIMVTLTTGGGRADAIDGGVGGDGASATLTILGNDGGVAGRPTAGPSAGSPAPGSSSTVFSVPGPSSSGSGSSASLPPGEADVPAAPPGGSGSAATGRSPAGEGGSTAPPIGGPMDEEDVSASASRGSGGGGPGGGDGEGAESEGSALLPLVGGGLALVGTGLGAMWWRARRHRGGAPTDGEALP